MKSSFEISDELKGISPLLAGIEKTNLFSVPDGYFSTLEEILLRKTQGSVLAIAKSENAFEIPENYFENLSSNILQKIKAQETASGELRMLSPMLYAIQDENVYEVPVGYFDSLSDAILERVTPKVVTMRPRSVWRYAAAAVMTGVIAVSSLMVYNKQQQTTGGAESAANAVFAEAKQYKTEDQINQGISKLSDDDIIKYLEKTGTATDNESLTSNIEESNLPTQQDYLLDEKVLDNYLDNSSGKNSN